MFDLVRSLPRLLRLLRGLLRDPRVAWHHKALLVLGIAWILSPIDPLPDFLPFVGSLDDAAVALVVGRYVLRRVPDAVLAEHWGGDLAALHRLVERGAR